MDDSRCHTLAAFQPTSCTALEASSVASTNGCTAEWAWRCRIAPESPVGWRETHTSRRAHRHSPRPTTRAVNDSACLISSTSAARRRKAFPRRLQTSAWPSMSSCLVYKRLATPDDAICAQTHSVSRPKVFWYVLSTSLFTHLRRLALKTGGWQNFQRCACIVGLFHRGSCLSRHESTCCGLWCPFLSGIIRDEGGDRGKVGAI